MVLMCWFWMIHIGNSMNSGVWATNGLPPTLRCGWACVTTYSSVFWLQRHLQYTVGGGDRHSLACMPLQLAPRAGIHCLWGSTPPVRLSSRGAAHVSSKGFCRQLFYSTSGHFQLMPSLVSNNAGMSCSPQVDLKSCWWGEGSWGKWDYSSHSAHSPSPFFSPGCVQGRSGVNNKRDRSLFQL